MKTLENLTELDLYDNKIKDLGNSLDALVHVTYVTYLSVSKA